MRKLDDFSRCVKSFVDDGRTSIECRLGLWSVEAASSDSAYLEAFHYWRQYAEDGEYSSIIGGPSVTDKMRDCG